MSRTPLHARVAADLRGRIRDRELSPGDLLPSESALQEQFSVSRSVVRQALATLEAEGLLRRAQGRGSVVAPQRELHREVGLSTGLMAQVTRTGSATTTRMLRFERDRSSERLSGLGDDVVVLERLRSVDGCPAAFIPTHLPGDVADALDREGLTDASLHEAIRAATGRHVADGRRTVRAVAAAAPLDEHLTVAPGTPLLLLEGVSLDQEGRALEVFSTWHRSDLVAFDLPLLPTATTPPDVHQRVERAGDLAAQVLTELRQLRDEL